MKKMEALFLGAVAALSSLVFVATVALVLQIISPGGYGMDSEAYLYAPFFVVFAVAIEELFKYLFISKKLLTGSKRGNLMINALMLGLGFALVEIFFMLFGNSQNDPTYWNILEISTIHTSSSVIIAWLLTRNTEMVTKTSLALLTAIASHLTYNLLVLQGKAFLASLLCITLFAVILTALSKAKKIGKLLA